MAPDTNKVMPLSEAVARFVPDGAHLSLGGFTINRNPMAAVHEIVRQRKTNLHLSAHSNGQGLDTLVGGGCVRRVEIAYAGTGRFSPTCPRFRKAVEAGRLQVEDYSNYQMTLRFMAGAMGVPFLPTRSGLGSDILTRWGISTAERKTDAALPDLKLQVVDNPFAGWTDATKVVLVPALHPDVTILHVQVADAQGTARIDGLRFSDVEQAMASKHVILTCENLAAAGRLRVHPEHNHLPFYRVDAVVPAPFGAYPTACHGCYDYDADFFETYAKAAATDKDYAAHLERYIHAPGSHDAFLTLIGKARLAALGPVQSTARPVSEASS